ncbi:hypothetical protein EV652_101494 [Kribbella steppae]|uniref:Cobalt/nickel transport protein n=1 Tax=Kribbella steppae TaxID=2512223 RepID=A0A4V2S178_9ACTN|nr:hypothetical protein [Kribbella steppae]TCO35610.1 hypothetical protein EV652_101494 [Kribbella steppae]
MNHRITAIAVIPFAFAFATAAPATASPWDPTPTPQQVEPWPDEGSGYPGYADQQVPAETVNQVTALHATSVALGAIGGITLAGAALGITLAVQRRRDHLPSTQGI